MTIDHQNTRYQGGMYLHTLGNIVKPPPRLLVSRQRARLQQCSTYKYALFLTHADICRGARDYR